MSLFLAGLTVAGCVSMPRPTQQAVDRAFNKFKMAITTGNYDADRDCVGGTFRTSVAASSEKDFADFPGSDSGKALAAFLAVAEVVERRITDDSAQYRLRSPSGDKGEQSLAVGFVLDAEKWLVADFPDAY